MEILRVRKRLKFALLRAKRRGKYVVNDSQYYALFYTI
jgi:hypothetical protein